MKTLVSVFFAVCFGGLPSLALAALHEVREVHYQMGTLLELTLWHPEPKTAKRIIRDAVREVHRLNEILSNFDPDSSISRLNRSAGRGRTKLPAELYRLLQIAYGFSTCTRGYFDVTVGPLLELWRESSLAGRLPDGHALSRERRRVGYQKLKLYGGNQAELLVPGMKIDLGGIGKGYAVDRIVERLKMAGVSSAFISFGGSSISAIGAPPGRTGWEIGIKGPDGGLYGVIQLRDRALSTSGSMGKFWNIAGKRYGHLIDPKTGMPATKARIATVIAPRATTAEALSKPLALLGQSALGPIADFDETEAVVISSERRQNFSDGFKSLARWRPIPSR